MLDTPPTPVGTLERARRIAREAGVRFVYTGNVVDPEGTSTWCPDCGELLVERHGYHVGAWGLAHGSRCATCGAAIPGRFGLRPEDGAGVPTPVDLAVAIGGAA